MNVKSSSFLFAILVVVSGLCYSCQDIDPAKASASVSKVSHAVLFEENFEPFPADVSAQSMDADSLRSEFFRAYHKQEYKSALEALHFIEQHDSVGQTLTFYRGVCRLSVNDPQSALDDFDKVLNPSGQPFEAEAKWYAALAQMKSGNSMEAAPLLEAIANGPEGTFKKEQAQSLLAAIH
ncbi:MAG: hypothetical protein AAGI38_19460 [Bacteroidota bacterium]